jgi:hypothetical protein
MHGAFASPPLPPSLPLTMACASPRHTHAPSRLADSDGDLITLTGDDDVVEALRCLEGGAALKIYVGLNSCASTATTITVGRSASTSAQSDAHRALFAAWRAAREELLKGRPVPPTVPRRLALPAGPPIKVRLPLRATHTRTAQTPQTERKQQSFVQCRSATRGALESVASARTQQSLQFLCVSPRSLVSR